MAGTTSDKLALLIQIKEAFRPAIIGKGQTISDDEPYSAWPAKVSAIETGIQLPTLTNPGGAADLRQGKQLIDQAGQIVNGTLEEVQQATPSISVSSSGLITATAGDKSATKQLDSNMDSDFVASNIKSGVNIFGVYGSYEGKTICAKKASSVTVQSETQLFISDDCIKDEDNIIAVYAGFFSGTPAENTIVSYMVGKNKEEYFGTVYLVNVMNDKLYPRNAYVNNSPTVSAGRIVLPANGSSYGDVFNTSGTYYAIIVYTES